MYYKDLKDGKKIYLLLYVHDMLITHKHMSQIDILKEQLNGEFEMKDLGLAKKILGIELIKNRKKGTLFFTQKKYV